MSESNANTAALCVRFLIPRNTARPMTGGGVSEVMTSQGHLVSLPPPHLHPSSSHTAPPFLLSSSGREVEKLTLHLLMNDA